MDDDEGIRRDYTKVLRRQGLTAETASNGKEAGDRVKAGSFDVIVSDISMPEMTGEPSLASAVHAVEYGAFRYLAKPVAPQELCETVIRAASLHKMAKLKREALELPGRDGRRLGDRATLEVRFSSGMSREGRALSVQRTSSPAGVTATSYMRYDRAGRLRAKAEDLVSADSMVCDPAGNLIRTITRRGYHVTQSFDVLNRVVTRRTPTVSYASVSCLDCTVILPHPIGAAPLRPLDPHQGDP